MYGRRTGEEGGGVTWVDLMSPHNKLTNSGASGFSLMVLVCVNVPRIGCGDAPAVGDAGPSATPSRAPDVDSRTPSFGEAPMMMCPLVRLDIVFLSYSPGECPLLGAFVSSLHVKAENIPEIVW